MRIILNISLLEIFICQVRDSTILIIIIKYYFMLQVQSGRPDDSEVILKGQWCRHGDNNK